MTKWHLARWIYTAFRSKFFHCRGVLRMTRDGSCMPDALFSPWTGAEVHWCICHLHVCKYSMTTSSISLNSLPFPIATTPQPSRGSVQTAKGRSSFPGSLEARLIFSWIKVKISPMVKKKNPTPDLRMIFKYLQGRQKNIYQRQQKRASISGLSASPGKSAPHSWAQPPPSCFLWVHSGRA